MSSPDVEAAMLASRLVVGLVLIRAGLTKFRRTEVFAQAVINYELVSERASQLISVWLPPSEIVLGLMLLIGLAQALVGAAVTVLLLVFAAAVGINLLRGRQIDCGCFGPGAPKTIDGWTVLRNVTLAVATTGLALRPSSALSVESAWEAPPTGTHLTALDGFAIVLAASRPCLHTGSSPRPGV